MKLSVRPPRTPSRLSDSIHHQLNLYALAASAAGVSVLALSHPADAEIVYTKTHKLIGLNRHYRLDLNHDKVTDFTLNNSTWCTDDGMACSQWAVVSAVPGNQVAGYMNSGFWLLASALRMGERIGGNRHFQEGGVMLGAPTWGPDWGQWYKTGNRYLGLKFEIKGKIHFGWARVSAAGKYKSVEMTLTGYAYETIANKPIIAGETKGPDVITLRPEATTGTLGRLALGQPGLEQIGKRNSEGRLLP